jgi:hypothetical protein
MSKLSLLTSLTFLAALASACYVDSDPQPRVRGGTPTVPPPDTSGDTGGTTSAPAPLLVEVDTDQTLNADPGKGVGVFVEYKKGGGWHVWWTCDTDKSRRSCAFTLDASLAGEGTITGVQTENITGAQPSLTNGALHITTTTASEVHGMSFQTPPGATLTLAAKVDSITDGSFLFFVQDGKVNGGYTGKLTNPLQFVGKTP